jgi:hypothetical protein
MAIDYYSTEAAKANTFPRIPIEASKAFPPFFRRSLYVVPTGGIAAAKTVAMIPVRKNEVLVKGIVAAESGALSTGCVLQFGDGTTVNLYGEGSANDGDFEFANTYATKCGQQIAADGWLCVTTKTGTAGLVAAKTVLVLAMFGPGSV